MIAKHAAVLVTKFGNDKKKLESAFQRCKYFYSMIKYKHNKRDRKEIQNKKN